MDSGILEGVMLGSVELYQVVGGGFRVILGVEGRAVMLGFWVRLGEKLGVVCGLERVLNWVE